MLIRNATSADLPAITDIYNYEVTNGFATFDIKEKNMSDMQRWLDAHSGPSHPVFVACEGDEVLGYASLSSYRERDAFAATVELSVYVSPSHRLKGVATALLKEILSYARECDQIHTVVSVITSGNETSVHLHEKFGFSFCGELREVGIKKGRLLGVLNYQLIV